MTRPLTHTDRGSESRHQPRHNDGSQKLIAEGDERMRFDLAADPGELSELAIDGTLEPLLPTAAIGGGAPVDMQGDVAAALRALGYLEREPPR